MKLYYLLIDKEQKGPYTFEDVKGMALDQATLVWTEGMKNWEKASTFYELKMYLKGTKTPPIPPEVTVANQTSIQQFFNIKKWLKSIVWTNKQVSIMLFLFVVFAVTFAWLIVSNTSLRNQKQALIVKQIKDEQALHDRIQSQEKYYNDQIDQLSLRMLQQEQQQQGRQEEERKILSEIQQQKLEIELDKAHSNLKKAEKYLREASAFQLFRSSSERERDIRRATDNLRFAQDEFDRVRQLKEGQASK